MRRAEIEEQKRRDLMEKKLMKDILAEKVFEKTHQGTYGGTS